MELTWELLDLDQEQLEDALDNLVTYALMKRKRSNTPDCDTFSIHPLIQHFAQNSKVKDQSIFLVANARERESLRKSSMMKAITLVGFQLLNGSDDWKFEHQNMGHIALCLDVYLPECDESLRNGQASHQLAYSLRNLANFQGFWGRYNDTTQRLFEYSVKTYETTFAAMKIRDLEVDLLATKQKLVHSIMKRENFSFENDKMNQAWRLLNEIQSRQMYIWLFNDYHILYTQTLIADYHQKVGRLEESLELFEACMRNNGMFLSPSHWVSLATINHVASLYKQLGRSKEAIMMYEKCYELTLKEYGLENRNTQDALEILAKMKHDSTDYRGALEYWEILASARERTFGLANNSTILALKQLEILYNRFLDREDMSVAKSYEATRTKRIKAEKILLNAKGSVFVFYTGDDEK